MDNIILTRKNAISVVADILGMHVKDSRKEIAHIRTLQVIYVY